MVFYGVSYGEPNPVVGDVFEFFLHRVEAERFIAACVADVPAWVDDFRIVEVDLHGPVEPSLS